MKVSLFVTCLADTLYPEVAQSAVRVLQRLGVDVDFPVAQTCCGQPAFNSGYWEDARAVAKQWLIAFADSDFVVTPSGSCAAMVVHSYPELFRDDARLLAQARQLADRTYELTQFLVQVLGVTRWPGRFEARATYHPSCHAQRLLGVGDAPLRLLSMVAGLELLPLPMAEYCCGFGGTFALKMAAVSAAMVQEKVECVVATGADILVGTDLGCLMNIGGRLQRGQQRPLVMHVAQLLDQAMEEATQ